MEQLDPTTIDGMIEWLESSMKSILKGEKRPDFDPESFYFLPATNRETGEKKMFAVMMDGDKYKVRDNVKTMLKVLGTQCNIVGFVSAIWIHDPEEILPSREGVMFKVETRAGPSRMRLVEMLRTKDSGPSLGEVIGDQFSADPPFGDMTNLFDCERTQPPPSKIAEYTGEHHDHPQNPQKQN